MVFVLSCVPPLGVLQLSRTKFQSPPAAKPLFTGVFLRAFFQALARESVPKGRPVQHTLRRPTIGFNGVFFCQTWTAEWPDVVSGGWNDQVTVLAGQFPRINGIWGC